MSNDKQSSVEWFLNKLIEHQIIKVGQTTYGDKVNYKHEIFLEQAKAMEKEQMIEFGELVWKNLLRSDKIMKPRDVYNETFGDNNEQKAISETASTNTAKGFWVKDLKIQGGNNE